MMKIFHMSTSRLNPNPIKTAFKESLERSNRLFDKIEVKVKELLRIIDQ